MIDSHWDTATASPKRDFVNLRGKQCRHYHFEYFRYGYDDGGQKLQLYAGSFSNESDVEVRTLETRSLRQVLLILHSHAKLREPIFYRR
jgi:hypothetical protein